MNESHATLTLGIALAAGVAGQAVARHARIPAIVLLLTLGAALGPEGLDWVQPRSLGEGLFGLVELGIAVILFEGGLSLQSSRLRRQERPIRYLVTVGALITLAGAALLARFLLDWSWSLAWLFGSLVVVTGPTVVTPLLRDMRLRPRLKTILEAEGVIIDPIGAFLAALVLQFVLVPVASTLGAELLVLGYRLGFGIGAGLVGGALLGLLLKTRRLIPQGLRNIFALSFVLLLFTVCEEVRSASGIMAVTVAGMVVGWFDIAAYRELREFKDQLTLLLVGVLFILLAADVSLGDITALGRRAAWVIVGLVLAVRPLSVWLSTRGASLSVRERLFIGWVAPRGIVAAAVASLTTSALADNQIAGGEQVRGLVFLTIASTVVLAGLTARPLASLLGLRLPSRNRVAILGADGLGLFLGDELKRLGVPVVFLDSDPKRCHQAQQRGHTVVFGDALDERIMTRAQFELVGTAVGATSNEHLNSLFVANSSELFGVSRCLVALEMLPGGKSIPQHLARVEGEPLFEAAHDIERWDVRSHQNQVTLAPFRYKPKSQSTTPAETADVARPQTSAERERFVILAIKRGKSVMVMSANVKLKAGDVASVAMYTPEVEEAIGTLAEKGWTPETPAETAGTVQEPARSPVA